MNAFIVLMIVIAAFLFPIFMNVYAYMDWGEGKIGFAIYLYGAIKILSGYAAPHKGGMAFHLTRKTAFLVPYGEMLNASKKFEITAGFSICRYRHVIEIGGNENAAAALGCGMALRKFTDIIFSVIYRKKGLRPEGDVLIDFTRGGFRFATSASVVFNLMIVACAGIKIILEKILENEHKRKRQKSQ